MDCQVFFHIVNAATIKAFIYILIKIMSKTLIDAALFFFKLL